MSQPPETPEVRWEPYQRPPKDHIRITETSCCAAYEWAAQGGHFLILRPAQEEGLYEETARGRYRQARQLWEELLTAHDLKHQNEEAARAAAERKRRTRGPRVKRVA
ncbi:hypothetical protein ITP53_39045 [Nonomuraea sp. K274]|uniref:Uncharacterized protein n=1 Tax=Nonomuraea cypriaca TaxID=1187855 RepID=A0A931AF61_9ACTN|nr:hypothetical protein [Nonomuraea cypriaca]MBF8191591.1 hypothetical protein [Nonomuraea cypriaca]